MTANNIENLIVDFYEVDAGWLYFKLTVGKQKFNGVFSEAFDPLLDFKYWLEAISIGVQQTSFEYDPEGDEIKFDLERVNWKKTVLTISEIYDNGEVFIKANVDRKQVVKAFYLGLLSFRSSDKFKKGEWETEYLKERLCELLNINEETLIKELVEFDKNELGKLLFNADPAYYITYPEAEDKNAEFNLFVQDVIDKDKGIVNNDFKRVETPIEWNIPNDYDYWTSEKKRNYVIECINTATQGFRGTRIDDFRSLIIEKYIDSE